MFFNSFSPGKCPNMFLSEKKFLRFHLSFFCRKTIQTVFIQMWYVVGSTKHMSFFGYTEVISKKEGMSLFQERLCSLICPIRNFVSSIINNKHSKANCSAKFAKVLQNSRNLQFSILHQTWDQFFYSNQEFVFELLMWL